MVEQNETEAKAKGVSLSIGSSPITATNVVLTKNEIKMKKNDCKDFFEAVGFEDGTDVKMMLKQIGFGMVLGLALVAACCLGELFT